MNAAISTAHGDLRDEILIGALHEQGIAARRANGYIRVNDADAISAHRFAQSLAYEGYSVERVLADGTWKVR